MVHIYQCSIQFTTFPIIRIAEKLCDSNSVTFNRNANRSTVTPSTKFHSLWYSNNIPCSIFRVVSGEKMIIIYVKWVFCGYVGAHFTPERIFLIQTIESKYCLFLPYSLFKSRNIKLLTMCNQNYMIFLMSEALIRDLRVLFLLSRE